jgi:hypothetical protein
MSQHFEKNEEWDAGDSDSEDDEELTDEGTDDDEEPTITCPYCSQEIHEDSQQCPRCGHYLSAEDSPPAAKPWWILIGAVVCLAIVFRWIV